VRYNNAQFQGKLSEIALRELAAEFGVLKNLSSIDFIQYQRLVYIYF
jgi:hypothetical protein